MSKTTKTDEQMKAIRDLQRTLDELNETVRAYWALPQSQRDALPREVREAFEDSKPPENVVKLQA